MSQVLRTPSTKRRSSSHIRIDGTERVTGRARYAGDWRPKEVLHAAVVLSTIPHGIVTRFDDSAATSIDGVKAIVSCFDDKTIWHGGEREHERRVFADRVRFVGDCVGAVAATSRDIARRAAASIEVEYDELPAAFSIEDARKPGAPKIWESGNLVGPTRYGFGDFESSVRSSDVAVEGRYGTSRIAHSALEPATSLAWWEGETLTVVASTQGAFAARKDIAEDLEMPVDDVRVIAKYKGGGFGNKDGSTYHDLVAALLAKKSRRPVLLEYSRTEDFLGGHTRWATELRLRGFAKRSEGRLLGVELECFAELGAYDLYANSTYAQGPESYYCCDAWRAEVSGVYTNTLATGSMRAPQNPHSCFAAETLVDELANAMALDPLAFRLKNAVVRPQLDQTFTSNGLKECLTLGAREFGWERRWRPPPRVPAVTGTFRGVGVALVTRKSNMAASEAMVKVNPDGGADLRVGVVDIGTGAKTTMSLIAANELGLPVERVKVEWGDTDATPYSVAESGSRMTSSTGQAVRQAARNAKERLLTMASSQFGGDPDEFELSDGMIAHPDGRRYSVREVMQRGGIETIEERARTEPQLPEKTVRHSFAAHFAEVAVDAETGLVAVTDYMAAHDSGEIVNRLTAESQVRGGVIMGMGMALSERLMTDPDRGSVQNPTFMAYRLTNHVAVPKIGVAFVETVDPYGPKGLGEISCVPVAPAIGNAIFNATGTRLRRLPFTAESLVAAGGRLERPGSRI